MKKKRDLMPARVKRAKTNYERVKTWRIKNRDKVRKLNSDYKLRHPEATKEQAKKDAIKYYHKTYQRTRILTKYGISYQEYILLKTKQNNLCAICGNSEIKRELNIDHNHITGKVRGLLCQKCNTGIGLLQDDIILLKKAIKYLKND